MTSQLWFHTTQRLLEPSTTLLSATEQGLVGRWPAAEHYDPDFVYVWREGADIECICMNYGVHTYEVNLEGEVELDPDYLTLHSEAYGRVHRATVIREWTIIELNAHFCVEIDHWFDYDPTLHGTEL